MSGLLTNFNFLLSFGNENVLFNMNDSDRHALLEKIIKTGPSENAWRAILELLASWPENNAKAGIYDWLNRELEGWSDAIRHINSSWTFLYENNKLLPIAKIARSVTIARREQYGNKELKIIVSSPEIINIRTLTINWSEIYIQGFQALAASPYLENLTALSLEKLVLSDEKFEALFGATNLRALTFLRLKDIGLNTMRTERLVNSSLFENIKNLDLSYNNLDEETAFILASSPKIKNIVSLNLQSNFIRDKGALALANAILSGNTREWNIAGNAISNDCRNRLREMMTPGGVRLILE
jgi:hypothetical protein